MLEWDSRIQNNQSIKILKTAIPFFDIDIGEQIDLEGLLAAVRPFSRGRERHVLDMILQFFQMRHMMDMLQVVQAMQEMQSRQGETSAEAGASGETFGEEFGEASPEAGDERRQQAGAPTDGMFEMLKNSLSPEQQDMVDMAMAVMSMMPAGQQEGEHEPVDI